MPLDLPVPVYSRRISRMYTLVSARYTAEGFTHRDDSSTNPFPARIDACTHLVVASARILSRDEKREQD